MYIPDEKVEEVRAASDVVDIVSDYVRLKKRGTNYFGLCPFHHEKTPSFSVNPSMGIFKCFGCGVGGNVFQFVMQVERVSFPESVRMLAERAGIPLPQAEVQADQANELESVYHALRFAARFFYHQLTQTEAGQPALTYLRDRGFTPQTIKRFGLGYAPDAWDALLTAAAEQPISPDVLEQAGLVIPRKDGSGHYDRYRGRVIFPILSHVGKVLGFGGRILTPAADQPKYINSPETRVYNKSRVLYGLYQAKQAIRRTEEAILVEGYTDVISLHQAGVEHVVAASGTALTAEQVKMLARYAKRVVLLYDADSAGASAALRGIDLVLEQGLSVYAVALPAGEDPDSYVRGNGGDAFETYALKHRNDFVAFKYAQAGRAGGLDTPEGQAETMRAVVASIARMPDPLMQETYMRRAAEVLGVPDIRLYEVLKEMKRDQQRRQAREVRREAAAPVDASPEGAADAGPQAVAAPIIVREAEALPEEKILLRLMLDQGSSMVELILGNMSLDEFTEGPAREAARCFLNMYEEGAIDAQRFFDGSLGADVQSLAAEVMMDRYAPSENWQRKQNISVPRLNEDPFEAAASAMALLKLDRVELAIEQLRTKIFQASRDGNEEDLRALQEEMMALHALRKNIEQRGFLNWNP
jgi:DNA primase